MLAGLYAMQGEFDHARGLAARSRSIFEELGLDMETARLGMEAGTLERLAGDLEAAASEFRSAYDALDAVVSGSLLSTVAGFLAQTLFEQGALDEAIAFCDRSRDLTTDADIATQALWRYVRGRILARAGRIRRGRSDRRAKRSRCSSRRTQSSTRSRPRSHSARPSRPAATVRRGARRFEAARALAEKKGGVVILSGVLRRLEDLDAARTTIEV